MTQFVKLNRVFVKKGSITVNTQSITVAKAAIASIRPSNRLGFPDHRSTITLVDGTPFDLSDTYSEVRAKVGAY